MIKLNKKHFAVLTLLLSILFMPSVFGLVSEEDVSEISLKNPKCYFDGSLSFITENSRLGKVYFSQSDIIAEYIPTGKKVDVQGTFSDEFVSSKSAMSRTAEFLSQRGQLNEEGSYKITMNYQNCKYPPCSKDILVNCPGYKYDCEFAADNFKIDSCIAKPDKYVVSFEGINAGQHETIDAEEEILLYFESNARTLYKSLNFEGKDLKQGKDDSYLLTFPRFSHEFGTYLALGIERCDPAQNKKYVQTCRIVESQEINSQPTSHIIASSNASSGQNAAIPANTSSDTGNNAGNSGINGNSGDIASDGEMNFALIIILVGIAWLLLIGILILLIIILKKS